MKIDIIILKYLYSKKNDGNFYDVSTKFRVFNPYKYESIDDYIDETPSSNVLNDSSHRCSFIDKNKIDQFVISLERNGYVSKKIKGYLPISSLTSEDDPTDANNSICMITPKGIEYYENYIHNNKTRIISVFALILSLISIIISLFLFL